MEESRGNWLAQYKRDVTSQTGEDGILEKIFEILKIKKGWCVEFGAWDGKLYSNTYNLIANHGWSAVLIEGDKKRFAELKQTYASNINVHCLHRFVGIDPPDNLDSILSTTPCPLDLNLISIDIDSFDYHVWESLSQYLAQVIVIEFNATIPNHISFIQPRDTKVAQGNSLLALIELSKKIGYELIAISSHNAFFVKKPFFPLFNIQNNSIDCMRKRSDAELTVFQLYDGTLVYHGFKYLVWSGEKIKPRKLQVLPKFLRFYSTNNLFKRWCRKAFRKLYRL